MEQTSRSYIIDAFAYLQEEIATVNHLQELIHEARKGLGLARLEGRDGTPWEKDISELTMLLNASVTRRRDGMQALFEAVESGNHQYRCLFKHALGAYQYATECMYANFKEETVRPTLTTKAYNHLIAIANKFLGGNGIETCGRCLADQFESTKKTQE